MNSEVKAGPGANRQLMAVWLVVTIAIATGIALLTLLPNVAVPPGPLPTDKIAHMLAFMILVLPTAALWPRISAMVGMLAVAYGGAIELIQPFTGRHAEMADLLADGIGVGLGIILGNSLRRLRATRRAARVR